MKVIHHNPFISKHIGDPTSTYQLIIKRLNENNIKWIAGGGTLLGLIRDKKLIPTDQDLDFILLDTSPDAVREVFKDILLGVEMKAGEKTTQLAYNINGVTIDFHFYDKKNESYECYHQAGVLRFPFFNFSEIETIDTIYGKVNIPKNPEEYLLGKYGHDWKTPQYQKKGTYSSTGMVFGCFDPIHYGHMIMLRRCYDYCRKLIIIVRTDEHIKRYKGREPFMDEVTRAKIVSMCGIVYISEDKEADYWVNELKPDFFFCEEGKGKDYNLEIPIIEIPRTKEISSSWLHSQIKKE